MIKSRETLKSLPRFPRRRSLFYSDSDLSFSEDNPSKKSDSRRGSTLLQNLTLNNDNLIQFTDMITKFYTTDFNIFELDELIEKKALFYISNEIFLDCELYNVGIGEEKFKEFINQITKGYYRDKSKYHNVIIFILFRIFMQEIPCILFSFYLIMIIYKQ